MESEQFEGETWEDRSLPDLAPVHVEFGEDASALARIAALLARAFANDPQMVAALPDAQRRARHLPWLIGLNVRYGCLYGEVYTMPGWEGAAIWLPPHATTFTVGRMARAGMLAAPLRLDWRVLARLAVMEGAATQLHRRYAPMPHWYLAQIGVEPSRQGQGIGSALLRSMLARIDREEGRCYLETTKQTNLRFYEKHGFRVVGDAQTRVGGVRMWGLLRSPGDTAAP